MAIDRDTLIFQKAGTNTTKDLYADFGIKTTSVPLFIPSEPKELSSRDWKGEDGEDVYFPEVLSYKSYESIVSVVYYGNQGSFNLVFEKLFKYLSSGGTEINIYSPYSQTGCKGAYFKGFSDINMISNEDGDVTEFKIKFRVTKPNEEFIVH